MSIATENLVIGMVILLLIGISYFIKNKAWKNIIKVLIVVALVTPYLINKVNHAKWDVVQRVMSEMPAAIILKPSLPEWEVNLTNKEVIITDQKLIQRAVRILNSYSTNNFGAKERIWETEMNLAMPNNDTIFLKVYYSDFAGVVVKDATGDVGVKGLKDYLEKVTNYVKPSYGK